MAKPILMPQIGENIETGNIIEWRVKEGDSVKKGDVIVIVESEKATFEVEAYESGVIQKILYSDGDEAQVLKPIAYLSESGEEISTDALEQEDIPDSSRSSRFASPSARRIAREHGLDINTITGSGPRGRIIKRDVLAVISAKQQVASATIALTPETGVTDDEEIPYSKMRKVIADRLTKSKQNIPHFYLFTEIDMTEALVWRKAYNEKNQTRVTITDMLVKATADALSEFRRINAHADNEKIILKANVNIGVAVSVSDGLLVPVIPDADKKEIQEISRINKANAEAAQRGSLRSPVLGTFTVTNLGMYSVSRFIPIINPPECAILGVGSIEKKVTAIGNGIHIRDIMNLCLACDHRAVDGVYAAQFLGKIRELMGNYKIL
jgi:pyruvate dehydrogenase E2 component (dihydrolipoamide acetyltransferase)